MMHCGLTFVPLVDILGEPLSLTPSVQSRHHLRPLVTSSRDVIGRFHGEVIRTPDRRLCLFGMAILSQVGGV